MKSLVTFKRSFILMAAAVAILAGLAFSTSTVHAATTNGKSYSNSVTITPTATTKVTVMVGESWTGHTSKGKVSSASVTSSKSSVVKATKKTSGTTRKYVFTAKKKGTSNIKVKEKIKGTVTLTVNGKKVKLKNATSTTPYKITVKKVKLNKTSATLYPNNYVKLTLPCGASSVKWSSTNTSVAYVSSAANSGVGGKAYAYVYACGVGTTTIKANVNGTVVKCKVTVKSPTINKSSMTLYTGKTGTLTLSNAGSSITWSSSNSNVASVSASSGSSAIVTAKKAGTATISAKTAGVTLTCTVTVKSTSSSSGSGGSSGTLEHDYELVPINTDYGLLSNDTANVVFLKTDNDLEGYSSTSTRGVFVNNFNSDDGLNVNVYDSDGNYVSDGTASATCSFAVCKYENLTYSSLDDKAAVVDDDGDFLGYIFIMHFEDPGTYTVEIEEYTADGDLIGSGTIGTVTVDDYDAAFSEWIEETWEALGITVSDLSTETEYESAMRSVASYIKKNAHYYSTSGIITTEMTGAIFDTLCFNSVDSGYFLEYISLTLTDDDGNLAYPCYSLYSAADINEDVFPYSTYHALAAHFENNISILDITYDTAASYAENMTTFNCLSTTYKYESEDEVEQLDLSVY